MKKADPWQALNKRDMSTDQAVEILYSLLNYLAMRTVNYRSGLLEKLVIRVQVDTDEKLKMVEEDPKGGIQ